MYRISLLPNHNLLCQELVIACARSNGLPENKQVSIEELKGIFYIGCQQYPVANADMTFEVIGETLIHVDRKVGDNYETVLILEQVDILEVPTISSYENTSLLDDNNHELLN